MATLIVPDLDDDAVQLVLEVLQGRAVQVVGDEVLLVLPPATVSQRRSNAARQRRWRTRQRNARNAGDRNARNAEGDEEIPADDPGYNPPRSEGAGGVGYPGERNASNARNGNAERVTRNALLPDAAEFREDVEPLTDEQREAGQSKIRELSEQLRASRST